MGHVRVRLRYVRSQFGHLVSYAKCVGAHIGSFNVIDFEVRGTIRFLKRLINRVTRYLLLIIYVVFMVGGHLPVVVRVYQHLLNRADR